MYSRSPHSPQQQRDHPRMPRLHSMVQRAVPLHTPAARHAGEKGERHRSQRLHPSATHHKPTTQLHHPPASTQAPYLPVLHVHERSALQQERDHAHMAAGGGKVQRRCPRGVEDVRIVLGVLLPDGMMATATAAA